MAVDINNLIISSAETIHAYNRQTGQLEVYLDELNSVKIANSEDDKEITGKGGELLKINKQNKKVEVTGESALVSGGLVSAQVGSDPVYSDTTKIRKPDILVIKNGTATTEFTAISPTGSSGDEVNYIYILGANGDITSQQMYTQTASASELTDGSSAKFTYDPSSKTIKVPTTGKYAITSGTKMVAFYDYTAKGTTITNNADVFGKVLSVYIDLLATDTCDQTYKVQIVMPRGQFSGTFDIDVSGDQVMQGFTINNLVDTCMTSSSKKLWDLIVYDDSVSA